MKKIIDGYENYSISDNGVVINEITSKVKSQFIDRKGYSVVTLFKDNKAKNLKIHRLVATAFIPNKNALPQINHINGIKTDNRVQNLEWCTAKENNNHKIYVLGKGLAKPVKCIETGIVYSSGYEASKRTSATTGAISASCKDIKRKRKSGGYHWEYAEVE